MGQKIAIKLPCLTELDWQEGGNKKREGCKFVFIRAETFESCSLVYFVRQIVVSFSTMGTYTSCLPFLNLALSVRGMRLVSQE